MFRQAPNRCTLRGLFNSVAGETKATAQINGKWVPARSMGYFSIKSRMRLAWGVFTSKYDALEWPEGQ